MWFNKDFITFTASFFKTGEAEFDFNSRDNLNELVYIWFPIEVFCRIHASARKSSLFYFNIVLQKFVDDVETFNFNQAIQLMNQLENDSFRLNLSTMKNKKEQIKFKFSGLTINTAMLKAYFQYNGLEKNMSYAFARLMVFIQKQLNDSSKEFLVECLSELAINEDFLERNYSFMNYSKIPKRIFEEKISKMI